MTASELKQAYQHIKAGDATAAREVLLPYVEQHQDDYNGWWLLANAVKDPQMRRETLERVLALNPNYEPAQQMLARMDKVAPVREPADPVPSIEKPKREVVRTGQYAYPLNLRFKIIALAPQIYVTDANDNPVMFVRQKILNLREDVRIFRDDSKTDEIFRINADRIIDIGARYAFTDSKTERSLGAIKQRGLKTIWKAHYDIEPGSTGGETYQLTEDNPWVKVADYLFGEIPFLGILGGYFIHPAYTVHDSQAQPVMHLVKEPAFFESLYRIDLMADNLRPEDENRVLLGLMMMVQLTRLRG